MKKLNLGELKTFQRSTDGKTIAIPFKDLRDNKITEEQLKTVFAILFDIDFTERYIDDYQKECEYVEGAIENENIINEDALPF